VDQNPKHHSRVQAAFSSFALNIFSTLKTLKKMCLEFKASPKKKRKSMELKKNTILKKFKIQGKRTRPAFINMPF